MSSFVCQTLERRTLFSDLTVNPTELLFNDPRGGSASPAQTLTLTNTTAQTLNIPAGGISVVGPSAARFHITSSLATPLSLAPGSSIPLSLDFDPLVAGPQGAQLQIQSDDLLNPIVDVTLRGLGTYGLFGGNEPSLQWILDTYQIPDIVGDSDPANSILDQPPVKPNDEAPMMLMTEATPSPVTVQPIAVFSNAATPALTFGYYTYTPTGTINLQQEFFVPSADVQTINPQLVGNSSFDPGSAVFGLYTSWPGYDNRLVYTEDFRNTWQPTVSLRHNVRFYPLKNRNGSIVPNAYVMAVEEAFNHDVQDGVFIVRNIKLATMYEAENATYSGAIIASTNAGFTGTGYVDFQHASNDFVDWAVNATAGTHNLTFRYANGGANDRPLQLKVNGIVIQPKLSFAPTGSWTTWETVTVSATLLAGLNQIQLTAIGFNGANFDSLNVI